MKVAFLGIGEMGSRMAPRLAAEGHLVTAWNRTPAKAKAIEAEGLRASENLVEALAGSEGVIMTLANGRVVDELLFSGGALDALPRGGLVIDMSSIPPAMARMHAARAKEKGHAYVDAPVSGGTRGAAEGTLAIMAGGSNETLGRARPVLECFGRVTHVGPTGSGQLTKLCNQVIVAVTIGAVGEALLLGGAGEADPAAVREALLGGFADSRILREHGRRMLDRDWIPGGIVEHQLKDLDTALAVAEELGLVLPVAERIRGLFRSMQERGAGGLDHAALLLELERLNPGRRLGETPDRFPEGHDPTTTR